MRPQEGRMLFVSVHPEQARDRMITQRNHLIGGRRPAEYSMPVETSADSSRAAVHGGRFGQQSEQRELSAGVSTPAKPKLLDQLRQALRSATTADERRRPIVIG